MALRGAWRARRVFTGRDRLLAEGVFVALVGYSINGVFLHPSGYTRYLWLGAGLRSRLRTPRRGKEGDA